MSITTFADLIAEPTSNKVVIADIMVGENLVTTGWIQEVELHPNAWKLPYLQEAITLNDGSKSIINKSIRAITADGIDLSNEDTLHSVNSTPNSFWHNVATSSLYVNIGGNPAFSANVLLGLFWVFFGTEAITIVPDPPQINGSTTSVYYEPYITNAPNIIQETGSVLSGFGVVGGGTLTLTNKDGFFNRIIDKFIWTLRDRSISGFFGSHINLHIGGRNTTSFSEFEKIFVGIITDISWSENEVSFQIRDDTFKLQRTIPETSFNTTDLPNMNANSVGLPVPIAYGNLGQDNLANNYGGRTAPVLIAQDESWRSNAMGNLVTFCIADQSILSVEAVWASPDSGATWFLLTRRPDGNPPIYAGEWGGLAITGVVDDASNNPHLTVKFAVDTDTAPTGATTIPYNDENGNINDAVLIKAAFRAPLANPSDIVKDILQTYLQTSPAEIDSQSFATSKTNSDNTIGLYIKDVESAQDIITRIADSDLAFAFVNRKGQYDYHVFQPFLDQNAIVLDRTDLLSYSVNFNNNQHFTKVKVGYLQSNMTEDYLYQFGRDGDAQNLYQNNNQKLIHTLLDNSNDARILSQRQLMLHKAPVGIVSGSVKWQMAIDANGDTINIGKQVKITSDRAPINSSTGYAEQYFEIVRMQYDFTNMRISFDAFDLKNFGHDVGIWSALTSTFATATDSEKQQSGWWCDDTGYANGSGLSGNTFGNPDGASLNVSLWW